MVSTQELMHNLENWAETDSVFLEANHIFDQENFLLSRLQWNSNLDYCSFFPHDMLLYRDENFWFS